MGTVLVMHRQPTGDLLPEATLLPLPGNRSCSPMLPPLVSTHTRGIALSTSRKPICRQSSILSFWILLDPSHFIPMASAKPLSRQLV